MAASMFVPIGVGELTGEFTTGLFVGIGAFLVASVDPGGPYPARAFAMAVVALGTSATATVGALAGNVAWLSVLLILGVVFAGGFVAVLGPRAGIDGFIVAIAFVVGIALPSDPPDAGRMFVELIAGGAFAIALSVARWPLDREQPGRAIVADAYRAAARFVRSALGGDDDAAATRTRAYSALRSAKDAALSTWRPGRERIPPGPQLPRVVALAQVLDGVLDATDAAGREALSEPVALTLEDTAAWIERGAAPASQRPLPACRGAELERLVQDVEAAARGTTPRGAPPPGPRTHFLPRLRASLTLESTAFRHAVRLGVAAAIGYLLSSLVDREHGVWMTTAAMIVLAPNFGGTLNRAVQRVGGTVLGAALAGAIAAATSDRAILLVVAGLFTVVAMSALQFGYGLFTILITPLAVLLTAAADPGNWEAADIRVLDTTIGGLIAVAVGFLVLPSWERDLIPAQLASTIRAQGSYLRAVLERADTVSLHGARNQAELGTTNAQAAVARLATEPARARRGLEAARLLADEATALLDASAALARRRSRPGVPMTVAPVALADAIDTLASAIADRRRPPPLDCADLAGGDVDLASIVSSIGRVRDGAVAFASE
jgi:uncharacterized membrane protein YccC